MRWRQLCCLVLVALVATACTSTAVPERVALDLVEQFATADVAQPVGTIDFGTPEARQFLFAGWVKQDERWAGRTSFVWGGGEESEIHVPIAQGSCEALILRGRPNAPLPGVESLGVELYIGSTFLSRIRLSPGFTSYEVPVPRGTCRPGSNWIHLRYILVREGQEVRAGAGQQRLVAWDWLRIRGQEDFQPVHLDPVGAEPALILPVGSTVDYYIAWPGPGALTAAALDPWGVGAGDHPMRLVASILTDGGPEVPLGELSNDWLGELRPIAIERGPARGTWTRLRLHVESDDIEAGRGLRLLRPSLRAAEPEDPPPAARPVASADGPPADRRRRPNVLIYLIDTLRADHLGAYGYDRPTSPRIDAFAEEAVVFEQALAQSSWTRTSVASILTGLHPRVHGVNHRTDALDPQSWTLARLLREQGYQTLGVTTNGNVSAGFGFDQGFDVYDHLVEQETRQIHQYSDVVNQRVFELLERRDRRRPFFLYVHTTDPHDPYTPPPAFRARFVQRDLGEELARPREVSAFRTAHPEVTQSDVAAFIRDLYDAEIAFNDHNFGQLIDRLAREDLLEETLVVLVSDHGEEFHEHGGWGHGLTLYDEQLLVPLIIRFPGHWGGGARVAAQVQHIDILPTILSWLGVEGPAELKGRALESFVGGPAAGRLQARGERLWSELDMGGRHLRSLRGRRKLIEYLPARRHGAGRLLFDLERDPGEKIDMSDRWPVATGFLTAELEGMVRRMGPLFKPAEAEADDVVMERLRALGYFR